MQCTFKGTESLPIMDHMPCQHRQAEITAETNTAEIMPTHDHATIIKSKTDLEHRNELMRWVLSHSGKLPRSRSDDKTEASIASWVSHARRRRTRAITKYPSGRQFTASETAQLNSILAGKVPQSVMKQRCRELGLFVYGDKQALLTRIVNEENRLTTDRQVTAEIKPISSDAVSRGNDTRTIQVSVPVAKVATTQRPLLQRG